LAAGQVTRVVGLLEEDRQLADATGHQVIGIVPTLLESYRGRAEHAMPLIAAFRQVAAGDGETNQGLLIALPDVASAILNNGLGRHDAARDASLRVLRWGAVGYGYLAVGELAEAASRTGDPDLVREALDWIHPHTAVTKSDWCFGIYERVCALASAGDADKHYQASIEYLARTRLRVDLARSHLLYGEWLRRGGRRIQARVQLRTAVEMLTDIGAEAFADRARRELGATGETARRRNDTTTPELTAQELNIAQLAIDGFTSPQIGLQLFLSTRTVEWHIRKIYAKLGINSRRQLSGSLPQLRR
jgi:DNA-binding CsgD family transcriptional regulator